MTLPEKSKGCSKLKSSTKSFLDTSVVIKQRAGQSAHKAYLSSVIPNPHYVNNYVRMEFCKALLLHLIHLYFESGESFHPTFGDALIYCSDRWGREAKAYLTAVGALMTGDGFYVGQSTDKEVCRQKLQDLIFSLAHDFEVWYVETGDDPSNCARVRSPLKLPGNRGRDDSLIDFEKTFTAVKDCRKRCSIERVLMPGGKYHGQIQAIQQKANQPGADERLRDLSESLERGVTDCSKVTCSSCEKLGDAIIAVFMPAGWKLHTLDGLHGPICEAIQKDCEIHPSATQIKKQQKGMM